LIGLIAFGAYYFFFFVRGIAPRSNTELRLPSDTPRLPFPPLELLDAVLFAGFALLSLFLMTSMFAMRGSFKAADVDVLFPTPVEPKHVLCFRMARDYFFTLIMPLFIALVTWTPTNLGFEYLFRQMPNPQYAGLTLRAGTVAWLLMALAWVAISYGISLLIERSDSRADRNRKLMIGGLLTGLVLTFGYLGMQIRGAGGQPNWVNLAHDPVYRSVFFTATAAVALVMAPFKGSWGQALVGAGSLVGMVAIGFRIAHSQLGWLYDQAAARGFATESSRELRKSGDMMGLIAEQARLGKVGLGRRWYLHRIEARGASALIWKEAVLLNRTMMSLVVVFLIIGLTLTVLGLNMPGPPRSLGVLQLFFSGLITFMVSMGITQAGLTEMLKRVDVLKPLPFAPSTIVFSEVVGKTVPCLLVTFLCCLTMVVMRVDLWQYAIATMIGMPFFALSLSGIVCLMMVLFPDFEDPTQRGFRGLMILLGLVICCAPSITAVLAMVALNVPILVAMSVFAVINLVVSIVTSIGAGHLFAGYNPSE
jgi:hypothetical protein